MRNYSVQLSGIAENERVILKLIFSVSQRTRKREIAYILHDAEQGNPDIVICAGPHSSDNNIQATNAGGDLLLIKLVDQVAENTGSYQIQRPLITSRVLSKLDVFTKEFTKTREPVLSDSLATAAPVIADTPVIDTDDSEAGPVESVSIDESGTDLNEEEFEINFSISEEEASELAIVHDELLENPANRVDLKQEDDSESHEHNDNEQVEGNGATNVTSIGSKYQGEPVLLNVESLPASQVLKLEPPGERSAVDKNIQNLNRALVVDDSGSVRKQLELELNLFDAKVDFAEDGKQAYEYLEREQYDVAFLDVVLPDTDGFSICKFVKEHSNDTSIIMLTGKATPADKVKGTLAGCDAYLVKPVGRMTFQNTVKNYLHLLGPSEVMGA